MNEQLEKILRNMSNTRVAVSTLKDEMILLHQRHNNKKSQLKDLETNYFNEIDKILQDKNNSTLERFNVWLNYQTKNEIDCLPSKGPLLEAILKSNLEENKVYNVFEILNINLYNMKEYLKENEEYYLELMEDMINCNICYFKNIK